MTAFASEWHRQAYAEGHRKRVPPSPCQSNKGPTCRAAVMDAVRAHGPITSKEAATLTGKPLRVVAAALSHFNRRGKVRGLVENIKPGELQIYEAAQ